MQNGMFFSQNFEVEFRTFLVAQMQNNQADPLLQGLSTPNFIFQAINAFNDPLTPVPSQQQTSPHQNQVLPVAEEIEQQPSASPSIVPTRVNFEDQQSYITIQELAKPEQTLNIEIPSFFITFKELKQFISKQLNVSVSQINLYSDQSMCAIKNHRSLIIIFYSLFQKF